MKKFITEKDIPEEKESYSPNTSYGINISEDDRKELQRLQAHYSMLIDKRKDELSSFIKVVLLNTYLYLTNMERDITEDINKIIKKSYYKDLNEDFKKMISVPSKEQDFIKELFRTRMLKAQSIDEEESEKEYYQFRLAKDDDLLKYIFYGSTMPINDYLTSLLDFFMASSPTTKRTILFYQINLEYNRCTKDGRYIKVNGKKLAPVHLAKTYKTSPNRLWFFDRDKQALIQILRIEIRDFEETNEYFKLSREEDNLLSAIQKCDKVKISFDITNITESTERYTEHFIPRILGEVKYDEETKHVELTMYDVARAYVRFRHLEQINGTDIANLNCSDNLKNLFTTTEETGIKFRSPIL